MNAEKVREVIVIYRQYFKKNKISKIDFPHEKISFSSEEVLSHCHGMLDKMEQFLDEGRIEKVFRWLGFIQGCLWTTKRYTIEELANHNRPSTK